MMSQSVVIWGGGAGGYFTTFLETEFSTWKNIAPNRNYGLAKMRGQKDLKSMKTGINWIENQEENWYKMLKIG